MIPLKERTPLYMVMITLGSALAAVTQWWIGLVSLALAFGLMEAVGHGLNRLLRISQRHH
ncbi:hypothetical protein BGP77_14735 [Saccharospirillum sp. MSK14-1]|uniref:hypothetical protein n=1 Tax=Saccharospirillum sp. MSK14-1 TaxID=1897632 RepID=UPI000D345495|nr:hypothetical protein [Saccharospirillum sp. MSK14-1]PTY37736.1 hypothetical protein BGP77_14735 [Saccharospirillum sp. MSK14-1]